MNRGCHNCNHCAACGSEHEKTVAALEIAVRALHRIQVPDYVMKADSALAFLPELKQRMGWAKEAEQQIGTLTGLDFYLLPPEAR